MLATHSLLDVELTTVAVMVAGMVATSMGTNLTGREASFSRIGTFGVLSCFLGDLRREGSLGEERAMVGLVVCPGQFMVERIQ